MTNTGGRKAVHIVQTAAIGGDALDIVLSNGNVILLQIELILTLSSFAPLREDDRVLLSQNQRRSVCWRDVPLKLPLEEIMELSFYGQQNGQQIWKENEI